MENNTLIADLKHIEEKYKDKFYATGEIRICDMAHDCRVAIEALQTRIEQLKGERDAAVMCITHDCETCIYDKNQTQETCARCTGDADNRAWKGAGAENER